jgi:hypothetical protein
MRRRSSGASRRAGSCTWRVEVSPSPSTPTALELGRLLAARELDPVSLAREAVEKARDARPAFNSVTGERALREAEESARRLRAGTPLGPLDGVPTVWKDLIDVEGVVTTAASGLRRNGPSARADATVVARLAAAGMVCIGKTNLSELSYSGLGLNPHFSTPPASSRARSAATRPARSASPPLSAASWGSTRPRRGSPATADGAGAVARQRGAAHDERRRRDRARRATPGRAAVPRAGRSAAAARRPRG